jgi:MGT family glycosyltransferase
MSVLAWALERRGHRVTILTLPDGAGWVAARRLETAVFGARQYPAGVWDARAAAMGRAEGRQIQRLAVELLLGLSKAIAQDLAAVIRALRLDGLVMDQICYGAESVAEAEGFPLAVACNALPMQRESRVPLCLRWWPYNPAPWARIRNRLDGAFSILQGWRISLFYTRHRRSLGLPLPRPSDLNEAPPSLAQVAQLPEFLDFPRRALPDHFHYTGPWLEEPGTGTVAFPWDRLDGRMLIYASLGTLQNGVDRRYEHIAAGCAGLDAQLVVALGRQTNSLPRELPGGPLVVPFAPQREVLARASLAIIHAGLNSTLETLSQGVPLVAIPIAHEQPGIAARLKRIGVAEIVPARELQPGRVREAVRSCLADRTYRERAQECALRLSRIDGPGLAAEVIERALVTRQRVRRSG